MHFHYRNINDAFRGLVQSIHDKSIPTVKKNSRNGSVMMVEEPVTVTYSHPRERVLFNTARDCNPLFHLYESLWMLAGRNDLAPLQYYVSDYGQFSDDGKTLNGAYGYRWRHSLSHERYSPKEQYKDHVDQLNILVNHLKAVPNSRRAVLTMWNVEDDLLKIGQRLGCCTPQLCHQCGTECGAKQVQGSSKDVCCNLNVMFALRTVEHDNSEAACDPNRAPWRDDETFLDMTVTNRSNDMIWGMLGANYVHFTMLQEYMAARLGVEVGKYHQITNNLHVYEKNWEPEKWLADQFPDFYTAKFPHRADWEPRWAAKWTNGHYVPLVKDPAVFEKELPLLVEQFARSNNNQSSSLSVTEPFFKEVAVPAFAAFQRHKERDYQGTEFWLRRIVADDWRIVCTQWIEKRKRMYENRGGAPFTQGDTNVTQGDTNVTQGLGGEHV